MCQGDLLLSYDCESARFSKSQASSCETKNQYQTIYNTEQVSKPIVQPVLSYIIFTMQSATIDNIKKTVLSHFPAEAILEAKHALWNNCELTVIGEKSNRQDSSKRSEKEAHVNDILCALQKLDKYNKVPFFVVDTLSLGMLPKAHPEELNSLSFIERQNNIEDRVRQLQE